MIPTEPWEAGLMAMGPAGRVAGGLGKVAVATAGMYGSMVDEASADPITKTEKKAKGVLGDILKPREYPPGHILHGMKIEPRCRRPGRSYARR